MQVAHIVGIIVGAIAFVIFIFVLHRIFVVDRRRRLEKLEEPASTEEDAGTSKADTNAEVFNGESLQEITTEGPAAWYMDVEYDSTSLKIAQTLKLGQCYLDFPSRCRIATTNLPVPLQHRSAFTVRFMSGLPGIVAVGLSWRPPPDKPPGHFIRSVGLQSDGFVHSGKSNVFRRTVDGGFREGDTITVLVDRIRGQVQWLKNGEFVIDAQQLTDDVPISMSLPVLRMEKGFASNVAIFPAIGLQGSAVVEVSFGTEGKLFPGLEDYDDLVFGRGDTPEGIEVALEAAQKNAPPPNPKKSLNSSPNASDLKKKLLKRSSTMPNPVDALEGKSTVADKMAKLRALRLATKKRGAISEDADRLQARFHQALAKQGIDAEKYYGHQVAQNPKAAESRLREAASALEINIDRCRFGNCQCKKLVLPEAMNLAKEPTTQEQLDPGDIRCTCCGHAMSYHRQLPGRRFSSILQIEDGQERACEILAGSNAGPRWRRTIDSDGTPRYYNIDTGEIINSTCPDMRMASSLELVKPNKERRDRAMEFGRKERPKRTRPIHTWYVEQKEVESPKSVKHGRRAGLGGKAKLREVVNAVSSPKSPTSPWSPTKQRNKIGDVAAAMMNHPKTPKSTKDEAPEADKTASRQRRSSLPDLSSTTPSGKVEDLKEKAAPFMDGLRRSATVQALSLSAVSEKEEDDNPV
eukprot:gnl/MRDRNA2_/MRDRNA2_104926_c0_seq1.p1 gnl/MRDRNA2_/MRDRNA2_104926_c0~~gnl/MRDRNA2_/MRDRNA2_104926_c0_seq1.p1  ORF type:complete len:692 (+),score=131.66 gnl/MRDRNA2_/MRDRNA2_104926_c0_seq1:120-2195(+)